MYGNVGKQVLLYEGYMEDLQEAGTTADFPTYLEDKVRRRFLKAWNEVESNWSRWAYVQSVPDFREITTVGLGEMPDLAYIPEDGEYIDSSMGEYTGPKIQLETWGRSFSIGRRLIINDMLGQINEIPARLARASKRTLARKLTFIMENGDNAAEVTCYDGNALFADGGAHNGGDNLLGAGTGMPLNEQNLQAPIMQLRQMTDQNGLRINQRATMLLIPIELEFAARRILQGTYIPHAVAGADLPGSSNGDMTSAGFGYTEYHALNGALEMVIDPYLEDALDYYVLVGNTLETAPVSVGFLNGKSAPDIMLQDPGMRLQLGGNDPYSFQFDRIQYKTRYDFAHTPHEYRGTVKVIGS